MSIFNPRQAIFFREAETVEERSLGLHSHLYFALAVCVSYGYVGFYRIAHRVIDLVKTADDPRKGVGMRNFNRVRSIGRFADVRDRAVGGRIYTACVCKG